MESCADYSDGGGGFLCRVLIILVVVVALVWVAAAGFETIRVLSVAHAVERHGEISITIKYFCESDPKIQMTRESDGRLGVGCEYAPGKWGVSIYESDGDHVTSFPNKSKSLRDLLNYFRNRGYSQ